MGKIKFEMGHFEEICKRGYSMDQIILLTWIQEDVDLEISSRITKVQVLYQSLIRKGLINDDGKIAKLGTDLLEYLDTKDPTKLVKKRSVEKKEILVSSDFNRWWAAYPSTNTFSYKGVQFNGDRSLRNSKDECALKLMEVINEGVYTIDEMIKAIEFEVLQKKEASVKEKTNKLKYMQNSLTYLNQFTYESFIDLIRKGVVVNETVKIRSGTDI